MRVIKKQKIEKNKLKSKLKLIKVSVLALILLLEINFNVLQGSLAYDTTLTTKNHNYPVYPLLTITLNGQQKDGLKAQTLIFNESSNMWETNYAIINKVQSDLNALTNNISELKQATIYDFNTSFNPGSIYVLLSPSSLSLVGEVANNTIDFILNHQESWWYVGKIFYDIIDLSIFDIKNPESNFSIKLKANHPNLIEVLDVFDIGFDTLIFYKKIVKEDGNVTYIPDTNSYSIINTTIIINYTRRDDIFATFYIYDYDSNNWTIYQPFIEYLNKTLNLLNEQYIFKSLDVKILSKFTNYQFLQQNLQGQLDVCESAGANMTPIVNENTTLTDIGLIIDLGTTDASFDISYTSDYSVYYQYYHQDELFKDSKEHWNQILQQYILIYSLLSHLWFCKRLGHDYTAPELCYGDFVDFPTTMVVIATLVTTALTIYVKRRRDKKL